MTQPPHYVDLGDGKMVFLGAGTAIVAEALERWWRDAGRPELLRPMVEAAVEQGRVARAALALPAPPPGRSGVPLSTAEAAEVLGVCTRQARRILPALPTGGRERRYDPAVVLAEKARRAALSDSGRRMSAGMQSARTIDP